MKYNHINRRILNMRLSSLFSFSSTRKLSSSEHGAIRACLILFSNGRMFRVLADDGSKSILAVLENGLSVLEGHISVSSSWAFNICCSLSSSVAIEFLKR